MVKENNQKEIKLTVAEAFQMDVGRGTVRIPSTIMREYGINAGDIVEIQGKSKAVAIVWRGRPEDEENNIIRMDGTLRFNAQVSIGETVIIRKVDAKPADSVTIAPVEPVEFIGDPKDYFHRKLIDKPVIQGQKIVLDVLGTQLHYVVTKTQPKGCVVITPETELVVSHNVVKPESLKVPTVSYEDIGGLDKEIELIREMVEIPIKHPELFEKLGIGAPKGVLLIGPPGTGKTLLAKAVASESDANFYSIAGPEIMSKYYGESEKQLRDIFEEAKKNAPSIIFIDEIDSIAPKRGEGKDQTEKRVVSQLLTLMDGLKGRGDVVVIAATNRPDDIDEALRRPGRFDREIRIMPPNEKGRKEILMIHTRGMPLADDVDLDDLAARTIGFTGADLEALCKEAAMKAIRPFINKIKDSDEKLPAEVLDQIKVKMEHFNEALKMVEPSAIREVMITKPKTTWEDIGGLEEAKRKLQEMVELPLKRPDLFEKAGIKPPKGIILYGPPGTGKTLLAKAVANGANANFIAVKGPELVSKWVGESEKRIREVFKKARLLAPSVVFFDEFDSISKVRGSSLTDATERMVNQLLTEIDGIEELEKVVVIAATNRIDLIDPSLLRPGRFDFKLEIGLPDKKSREQIFKIHTRNMPLEKGLDLNEYIEKSEGWSGADIEALCREAGMNAIREALEKNTDKVVVRKEHFDKAYETVLKEIKHN